MKNVLLGWNLNAVLAVGAAQCQCTRVPGWGSVPAPGSVHRHCTIGKLGCLIHLAKSTVGCKLIAVLLFCTLQSLCVRRDQEVGLYTRTVGTGAARAATAGRQW
eukprot:1195536-Rhodomonas_salina.1